MDDIHQFFLSLVGTAEKNLNPEFKVDPKRISIMGASAGAYMALMQSSRFDNPARFKCVIDAYGPTDLYSLYNSPKLPISRQIIKSVIGNKPDILKIYSPMYYLKTFNSEKLLILHSVIDNLVPVEQSQNFAIALRKSDAGKSEVEKVKITEQYDGFGIPTAQTITNFDHNFSDTKLIKLSLDWISNCK